MSEPQVRVLKRPYFLLEGVSEVPEARYHGMKVGLPPLEIIEFGDDSAVKFKLAMPNTFKLLGQI
jgi:hypothetical protein